MTGERGASRQRFEELPFGYGSKSNHQELDRRFLSLVPFTRVPVWVPIFHPQPFEESRNARCRRADLGTRHRLPCNSPDCHNLVASPAIRFLNLLAF